MLQKLIAKFVRPKLPDAAWLWEASHETQYTPDIATLESYKYQIVFVVDEFKRGFPAHELISSGRCVSLGRAYTRDPFLCWKKPDGANSFPIPIIATDETVSVVPWFPRPSKIKGELYAISSSTMRKLDTHRKNGVQFTRQRVRLTYPYRQLKRNEYIFPPSWEFISKTELAMHMAEFPEQTLTEFLYHHPSAWMYIGRTTYWEHQFGETAYDCKLGKIKIFEPRKEGFIGQYYDFTKFELKT